MEQYLGTDELPKNDLITYLQKNADSAFLRHWKLTGTNKSIRKNRNCSQLIAAYKVYVCIWSFSLCMAVCFVLNVHRPIASLCFAFIFLSSVKYSCVKAYLNNDLNYQQLNWMFKLNAVTILIFRIINLEHASIGMVICGFHS